MLSPPVSAAAFDAVGELSLLGHLGTVIFLDFSILKVMVSSSALQLETCYGVVALSYLLFAKSYLSAKLASSSVVAGPCSNKFTQCSKSGQLTKKTEKSRKTTVPEWPRRETSPTTLKIAVKTGGLSNPHKGKGAMRLKH